MIDTMDLTKFETGLDLEKEFNRIVLLARSYEISQVEAGEMLDEIYDYGVSTGKFTKSEQKYYMDRKNTNRDGSPRTHLQFALNLINGQAAEHKTFLYFVEWAKKEKKGRTITWELNGSDLEGYVMIVKSDKLSNKNGDGITEPDYKLYVDKRKYLVEAKSFKTPPFFKVNNLEKYKTRKAYLVFQYNKRYYIFRTPAIESLLEFNYRDGCGQKIVQINQQILDILKEKETIQEI